MNKESIEGLAKDIKREIEHWKEGRDKGIPDPLYPDGTNMNLTRNHIIYDKRRIREICEETGEVYPAEYYLPMPPEVSDSYMASLSDKERIERIKLFSGKFVTKKPKHQEEQLSLF